MPGILIRKTLPGKNMPQMSFAMGTYNLGTVTIGIG